MFVCEGTRYANKTRTAPAKNRSAAATESRIAEPRIRCIMYFLSVRAVSDYNERALLLPVLLFLLRRFLP